MNEYGIIYNALAAHRLNPFDVPMADGGRRCSCGTLCTYESTWREHLTELIVEKIEESRLL